MFHAFVQHVSGSIGRVDHHSTLSNFINVIPRPSPDGLIAIICGSLQIKAKQ